MRRPPPHPTTGSSSWPLTGRDDELAFALRSLAGEGGLVLTGSAGVGKSRLAQEALSALRDSGQLVISCAATTAAAAIPFGAVADLVGRVDTAVTDRLGVLQAVAAALGSGPAPVVGLDDAHLADDATAALVHHLVTHRLIRVLLTVRSGEPVPDAVTALWKDGHCARLDLQALSREEADDLTATALGGPLDASTRQRLWDTAGGNPLLLRELVLQALDDGSLTSQREHWHWSGQLQPGERLIDVVRAGLGRLSPTELDALATVAYGAPLDLPAVERLTDPTALKHLLDRGILQVDLTRGSGSVALGHPLYGEVVRSQTGALDARRIRRALVAELSSRDPLRPGDAGRICQWALDSDLPVGSDLVLAGAQEAYRGSDFPLAARLAASDPDWATRRTGHLLGASLVRLERDEEALAVLARAALDPPDPETRTRIAHLRTELLFRHDRLADAERVFAETTAALDDPWWQQLLTARWAPTLVLAGRREEAAALVEPLVGLPDGRIRLAAVRAMGYLLIPSGRTTRMIELCDTTLASALMLKGEWEVGVYDVVATRTAALLMEGRLGEIEAVLALGERANADLRDPVAGSYIAVGRARVALCQGRPATAERLAREALAGFSRLTGVRGSWTLRLLAEALALLGDAEGSRRAASEASSNDGLAQEVFARDGARAEAWSLVAAGDVQGARAHLQAQATDAATAGDHGYEALILHDLLRLGASGPTARRLEELAALVDGPIIAVFAAHARTLVADDGPGLDEVSRRFEDLTFMLLAAEAATEAASAHRRAGLVARATAAGARAAHLGQRCEGARTPALVVDDGVDALTPRERDVAAMAARGLASKEIAESLVLSRRTVDNHLHRAYEKLGIRRREELADALGLV